LDNRSAVPVHRAERHEHQAQPIRAAGVKGILDYPPEERWLMVYTLDAQGRYGQPGVFGMDEPTCACNYSPILVLIGRLWSAFRIPVNA